MKPKTKATADALLADPELSQTQAYIDNHETTNRKAASVEASRLLAKPSVQIYMKKHEKKAKEVMVKLMSNEKPDIQYKAATDILDRNLGKATQRTESQNINLNLDVPVSKELGDQFTEFMKQSTSHVEPL